MSRRRRALGAVWVAGLLSGALLTAGCRADGDAFSASGTLEVDAVTIRAPQTGRLGSLVVEEGDAVFRGDPLASFDSSLADAEVEVATAALAVAKARLALLSAQGVGSATEEYAQSVGAVAAARAALAAKEAERAALDIASPIDGQVMACFVEPGEVVAQGAALFRVADLERLTLTVFVPTRHLAEVAIGDTVDVVVDAFPDEGHAGSVISIADEAEFTPRNVQSEEAKAELAFRVRLAVADQDERLRPGMTATATWHSK